MNLSILNGKFKSLLIRSANGYLTTDYKYPFWAKILNKIIFETEISYPYFWKRPNFSFHFFIEIFAQIV